MALLTEAQRQRIRDTPVGAERDALRTKLQTRVSARKDTTTSTIQPIPAPTPPIPSPTPKDTTVGTVAPISAKTVTDRFDPTGTKAGEDRDAARLAFQQQRQADRKTPPIPTEPPKTTTGTTQTNNLPADFNPGNADFAITAELMQMFLDQDSIVGNEALMAQVRAMNPNLLKNGRPLTDAEWHNRVRAALGLDSANAGTSPFRIFDPNTGLQIGTGRPGTGTGGSPDLRLVVEEQPGFGPEIPTTNLTPDPPPTNLTPFPPPAGNVPPIDTEGVTEQGDTFSFENEPIIGGRIDALLEGLQGVEQSEMRKLVGNAISGILLRNPNADPNVVLDRLANVREQMIPLRESAKSRVATDLARMGLADSPAVMAQALAGVEAEINNMITQRWREVVDDEQERAQEQFMRGIQLGGSQEESDRNFKIQQMDQALQRAGIEAQERLDLIRLANDARAVFNSGRQIDANIALDNLRFNLSFQQFLHNAGMDLAQFQLAVEQARFGNALELQRLLLQYMNNLQQGFI